MCYSSTGYYTFKAGTVYIYSSSKSSQHRIVDVTLNFPGRVLDLEDNEDYFQLMFATKSNYFCELGGIAIEIESRLEEQPQDNARH